MYQATSPFSISANNKSVLPLAGWTLDVLLLYYYLLYYFFIALRSFLFTMRTTVFTAQTARPHSKSPSKLKNGDGVFVLRFALRRRFSARDFIEIITVSFALDQIPFINHQVDIVVERSPANPGIFLCVLLGQIEIVSVLVGRKIEIQL